MVCEFDPSEIADLYEWIFKHNSLNCGMRPVVERIMIAEFTLKVIRDKPERLAIAPDISKATLDRIEEIKKL